MEMRQKKRMNLCLVKMCTGPTRIKLIVLMPSGTGWKRNGIGTMNNPRFEKTIDTLLKSFGERLDDSVVDNPSVMDLRVELTPFASMILPWIPVVNLKMFPDRRPRQLQLLPFLMPPKVTLSRDREVSKEYQCIKSIHESKLGMKWISNNKVFDQQSAAHLISQNLISQNLFQVERTFSTFENFIVKVDEKVAFSNQWLSKRVF